MASTQVTFNVTPEQIQAVVDSITEELIEHRAAEIVKERGLDKAAVMTEIADRAVRVARYSEYCETFNYVWVNVFPDGPFPRDNEGRACDGWKLSEDGTTEKHDEMRAARPARLKATDQWAWESRDQVRTRARALAHGYEHDEDGNRRVTVTTRTDIIRHGDLADA